LTCNTGDIGFNTHRSKDARTPVTCAGTDDNRWGCRNPAISALLRVRKMSMIPVMSEEEYLINLKDDVAPHEEAVTEDANQIAVLKAEIAKLKEQHGKEIEALQGDIKNLVELVWCVVHRVTNQSLVRGIDARHGEMALNLANKHGVAFAGSQE
jgi:hypothetical protein